MIDNRAFSRHTPPWIGQRRRASGVAGGTADIGRYFVRPTVFECTDAAHETFTTEYFGPILGVHVFDDGRFDEVVAQAEAIAPYALTGAIFADDRRVVDAVAERMRYAAGNFYINDKPTGAVVGQQPFGGARASGTTTRPAPGTTWCGSSAAAIKETFVSPTDHTKRTMG